MTPAFLASYTARNAASSVVPARFASYVTVMEATLSEMRRSQSRMKVVAERWIDHPGHGVRSFEPPALWSKFGKDR